MSWIILEGVDRSGKSSVAKMYKSRGYEVVHMSAPDKKYSQPGYAGPSYMDELMDRYMAYNGHDVVFDRSPYGECVWPLVYGRKAQLTEEDIEILQEIENANGAERLMFFDQNAEAHWKRCVDNKEPLTKSQFNNANVLFDRMATKYEFKKVQLTDFTNELAGAGLFISPANPPKQDTNTTTTVTTKDNVTTQVTVTQEGPAKAMRSVEQMKLDKANAINEILSGRIIKKKGDAYDDLERDIRTFLQGRLSTIFGKEQTTPENFSRAEVEILKMYCKQVIKKMETR